MSLLWLWPRPTGQKPLAVTNENENQLGYGFLRRREAFVFAIKALSGNPKPCVGCGVWGDQPGETGQWGMVGGVSRVKRKICFVKCLL